MKIVRRYKAEVVDNKTLKSSTVEGSVELPDSYPRVAYVRTARGQLGQAGKTVTGMEIDGKKIDL